MKLKEREKIIQFMSLISTESDNIRAMIQNALHEVWGYDVMAFWYTDSKGNIDHPVLFGVPNKVIYDYVDQYEQYDFLHPKLYINQLQEQSIFNVQNTISFDNLKNETYFVDFMKKYNYVDEMVVNFIFQDKLIGTLGFLAKKEHGHYNQVDVDRFQAIANIIANKLIQSEKTEELKSELEILRKKMDLSSSAYIIVNKDKKVLYKNESALKYSNDLMNGKTFLKLETLIKKALEMLDRIGSHFKLYTKEHQYHFQCINNFGWQVDNSLHSFLLIKIERKEKNSTSSLKEKYNLTKRELEVCHCIVKGMTNEQIAEQLFITINTVKRHVQNTFKKLNIDNRTSIVRLFLD